MESFTVSPTNSVPAAGKRNQRLKAVCVITDGRDYLFAVGDDPMGAQTFLIPVGGGIEFGEYAVAAAVREVKEEIGLDITGPRLLGVLEQIFAWNGAAYHEIVFSFIVGIPDRNIVPSHGIESNGERFPLRWLSQDDVLHSPIPVFPEGLIGLLFPVPPSPASQGRD